MFQRIYSWHYGSQVNKSMEKKAKYISITVLLKLKKKFSHQPVFDMGSKAMCAQNYVEIIESNDAPSTKFCADDNPAPYKGRSNRLSVHFKSTANFAGTGWSIEFMAVHASTDLLNY